MVQNLPKDGRFILAQALSKHLPLYQLRVPSPFVIPLRLVYSTAFLGVLEKYKNHYTMYTAHKNTDRPEREKTC